MIDSHQHFWQYEPVKDAWITNEMAQIQRSFMPTDLQPLLSASGIRGCVAVQAAQSETETMFLLSLAQQYPFIKGIVGWVDFQHQHIKERLQHFSQFALLKGWRHIVQAELPGFILQPAFLNWIKALSQFGYTYDVLISHAQLPEVMELVDRFPHQPFVIDHCAKPNIRHHEIMQWEKNIRTIAQNPNIYCKLSGLLTEADWKNWDQQQLYTYFDVVFDCFGPKRLMFGSDWPVLLLAADYRKWFEMVQTYVQQLSSLEQQQIFGDNAIKFYKL